jgi:hypothetical protein
MIFDGLAILQDLGNSLDMRRKLGKFAPEALYVGDLKEEVGLGLLGKAAPVGLVFQSRSPALKQDEFLTRCRPECC